jgi:O-antigen ligase
MKAIDLRTNGRERPPLETALLVLAAMAPLFSLISISLLQGFWSLALVAWAVLLLQKKRAFAVPGFFWPLLAYSVWTLVSSAASIDPGQSFKDSRELLGFLVIPIVLAAFPRKRGLRFPVWAIFASGALASAWAIIYFLTRAYPGQRIKGFMGHYMTQAGLLGLFIAFGLAMIVFGRGKTRLAWAAVLAPAGAALIMTLTRNAWLGVAAAGCLVLFLWKPKALLIAPLAAGLIYLAGPPAVKSRVQSIFDRHDPSNMARLEYARAGLKIIGEKPFFGTGPDTVDRVFQDPKYGLSGYARGNVHLHNNFLQIAAERGLPTLAAWLVFFVWAFLALFRRFKTGGAAIRPLAAGGMAALAALITAGFFEYNFGDSEIALFVLLLISLPFAGGADES